MSRAHEALREGGIDRAMGAVKQFTPPAVERYLGHIKSLLERLERGQRGAEGLEEAVADLGAVLKSQPQAALVASSAMLGLILHLGLLPAFIEELEGLTRT